MYDLESVRRVTPLAEDLAEDLSHLFEYQRLRHLEHNLNNLHGEVGESGNDDSVTMCPRTELYEWLNKWCADVQGIGDGVAALTDDQVTKAVQWWERMKLTCEYKAASVKTSTTAAAVLSTAITDAVFRNVFFGQLEANLERCQDRTAMAFNEAYCAWRLHTACDLNDRAKLELCSSAAKTAVLRRCLTQEAKGSESVETYLWVETRLKQELGLLTFADEAHYSIGANVVDLDAVRAVVESGWRTELYAMLESQPNVFPTFPLALTPALAATMDGKLDAVESSMDAGTMTSGEYMEALDELQAEQRRALQNARDRWFARCGTRQPVKGRRKKKSKFRHRCR